MLVAPKLLVIIRNIQGLGFVPVGAMVRKLHDSGLIKNLKNSRCTIGCLKANNRNQEVDLAFSLKEMKVYIVPFYVALCLWG